MTKPSFTHALHVGSFFVLLYILCLAWPMVYPYGADVLAYHMLSLKLLFPGFTGYSSGSLVWGAVMSFAYGFAGSLIAHSLHGSCCGKTKK